LGSLVSLVLIQRTDPAHFYRILIVRKALSADFDELLQNSVYRPLLENELFLVFAEYQLPIEDAVGFSILKSMAM
jgi:hypothetical protein